MDSEPTTEIILFGGFRLTYLGEPVSTFAQARLRDLLVCILLQRGRLISRQQLAFTFWPDTPEKQARTNLRNLLHRLRDALPDSDRLLEIGREGVRWRTETPIICDLFRFDATLAEADTAREAADSPVERAALTAAADLYTGPLMSDCYADWLTPERERTSRYACQALERLVILLAAEHDDPVAMTYAQRLVQIDPLHEGVYRHLMLLHARRGDRTGVVRAFNACETALRHELDVKPAEETRATYVRCLRMAAEYSAEPVAPRTAPGGPRGTVPRELTSLVGRDDTLEHMHRLLASQRLITLTGAGGVGKTRLAQRLALQPPAEFVDGVVWVDLAPLSGATAVTGVASALGLRESATRPTTGAIADHLAARRLLLVLDNCERVVEHIAPLVRTLLLTAPRVHILVTSQRSLGLAAGVVWRVPALPVPLDSEARSRSLMGPANGDTNPSVQLFVERARALLPTYTFSERDDAAVAQICRRLGGIPLAIELAASRIRTLSPEQIAARLEDVFALLTRPAITEAPHQHTILAAMDWSCGLLPPQERILFRRLAAFASSFTLEAAEDVCAADDIPTHEILTLFAGLEDKSLIEGESSDGLMRFRMHEVVRQYAAKQLVESGEETHVRTRHLAYYAQFAALADTGMTDKHQAHWLNVLHAEHDNLRAALAWSLAHPEHAELGLRIVGRLTRYWQRRGHAREGLEWAEALIKITESAPPSLERAHALRCAGHLFFDQVNYPAARAYYEQALVVARAIGHKPNIGAIVRGLGAVAHQMGDYATAINCYHESLQLCHELGDPHGEATSLGNLGLAALQNGDPVAARAYLEQCLVIRRGLRDEGGIAWALHVMADVAWLERRQVEALQLNEEALRLRRQVGDRWGLAYSLDSLAVVTWQSGDIPRARSLFAESLTLFDTLGNQQGLLDTLGHFLAMLAAEDQWQEIAVLLATMRTQRADLALPLPPNEQAEHEALQAQVHAHLSTEAADAAALLGRVMIGQQVVPYALNLLSDSPRPAPPQKKST